MTAFRNHPLAARSAAALPGLFGIISAGVPDMMQRFLINPQVEFLVVKAIGWAFVIASYAFAIVYFLRFARTRANKLLFVGLSLVLLSPLVYTLLIKLEKHFLANRMTTEMADFYGMPFNVSGNSIHGPQ